MLLVGGDLDPSGEDITRSWRERTDCWDVVKRVALSEEQVDTYGLPRLPGKATDPRADSFRAAHDGELFQVELDALPPDVLREVYTAAVDRFRDMSAFERWSSRRSWIGPCSAGPWS